MAEKIKIRRKSHNVLRFNMDFWNEIKTFVEKNYKEYFVKIVTADQTDIIPKMDDAYEKICEYTESIETIEISAEADDEKLAVEIVNREGAYFKYTIKLEAECNDNTRADGIIYFMESISKGSDIFAFSILLAFGIFTIFVLNFLSLIFRDFHLSIGVMLIIILCVFFILGIAGILYLNVMINNTWSIKRIQFWTDYRNITQYIKLKRAGYIYAAISLVFAIALFVVGYLVII